MFPRQETSGFSLCLPKRFPWTGMDCVLPHTAVCPSALSVVPWLKKSFPGMEPHSLGSQPLHALHVSCLHILGQPGGVSWLCSAPDEDFGWFPAIMVTSLLVQTTWPIRVQVSVGRTGFLFQASCISAPGTQGFGGHDRPHGQ